MRNLSGLAIELTSFDLSPGECVTLLGPSGSGKTMLLRALADLDPNVGEISLNRIPRGAMPAPHWRRAVTYVAAKPGWWADRVSDHYADWPAAQVLAERLALAEDCGSWPVERLSTGEAQRLGLVRALVQTPKVLLLDEPTAALDAEGSAAVEAVIEEERDGGMAVLWVTHDIEQARRLSSRCLRFRDGRIEESPP